MMEFEDDPSPLLAPRSATQEYLDHIKANPMHVINTGELPASVQKMLDHLWHNPPHQPPAFIKVTAADGKLEALINPDHITCAIPNEGDSSKSEVFIVDRAYALTVDTSLEDLLDLIETSRA